MYFVSFCFIFFSILNFKFFNLVFNFFCCPCKILKSLIFIFPVDIFLFLVLVLFQIFSFIFLFYFFSKKKFQIFCCFFLSNFNFPSVIYSAPPPRPPGAASPASPASPPPAPYLFPPEKTKTPCVKDEEMNFRKIVNVKCSPPPPAFTQRENKRRTWTRASGVG